MSWIGRLCVMVSTLAPASEMHRSSALSTPGVWSSIIDSTALRLPAMSEGSKMKSLYL